MLETALAWLDTAHTLAISELDCLGGDAWLWVKLQAVLNPAATTPIVRFETINKRVSLVINERDFSNGIFGDQILPLLRLIQREAARPRTITENELVGFIFAFDYWDAFQVHIVTKLGREDDIWLVVGVICWHKRVW